MDSWTDEEFDPFLRKGIGDLIPDLDPPARVWRRIEDKLAAQELRRRSRRIDRLLSAVESVLSSRGVVQPFPVYAEEGLWREESWLSRPPSMLFQHLTLNPSRGFSSALLRLLSL